MVDGAHAFAHINFSMKDLDCDYYGTSLHKWLSTPLGAGMLYVKKNNIPKLWPLFAEWNKEKEDVLRLNHTGTHPVHTDLAIGNAIEYLNKIGMERKEARLRYIQNYWVDKVRDLPHINLNTPVEKHRSCAISSGDKWAIVSTNFPISFKKGETPKLRKDMFFRKVLLFITG